MRIGIIGAGHIGGTVGRLWADAGHNVRFAARDSGGLAKRVAALGASVSAGSLDEVARFGECVFVATPFKAWPDLARDLAAELAGKTVIDAANLYPERDGAVAEEAIAAARGSLAYVARLLPAARLVKAFNTLYWETLRD